MFYLLAAVSAIVTLVAGTVAIGLAAVELDGDLAILAAVGATPRILGQITAVQAALIVGIGAFLGLLAGIGPATGYVGYSVEVSWHTPSPALLVARGEHARQQTRPASNPDESHRRLPRDCSAVKGGWG